MNQNMSNESQKQNQKQSLKKDPNFSPRPKAIHPLPVSKTNPKPSLEIEWNTGEKLSIPYWDLRFACPCAGCVDELTGIKTLKAESVDQNIRPLGVESIGQYAISIQWSDGHTTGMYHFDRLYQISKSHHPA